MMNEPTKITESSLHLASEDLPQLLDDEDNASQALSKAKALWFFGDWQSLAGISRKEIETHPERGRLALLVASANCQTGNDQKARELVRAALDWDCPPRLIAQVLAAGVHNSLGRAAALQKDEQRLKDHFSAAVATVAGQDQAQLVSQSRAVREMSRLGLMPQAVQVLDTALTDVQTTSDLRPLQKQASLDALKREMALLRSEVASRQQSPAEPTTGQKPEKPGPAMQVQQLEQPAEAKVNPYDHNRSLTPVLDKQLKQFAAQKLGLAPLRNKYLYYLADKVVELEKRCVGRLATTVQDMLVRLLVAECIQGKSISILEIGALYGVSLGNLYNHVCTRFSDAHITCLDPFDGYYGKSLDAVLNQAVDRTTFQRNMQLAQVEKSDYTVIEFYSTAERAKAIASKKKYDVLIIDGDHSYEGVKFDFENYFSMVQANGFAVFDDYNAKEWPGVQAFVDKLISEESSKSDYRFIGAFSRTAVFQQK